MEFGIFKRTMPQRGPFKEWTDSYCYKKIRPRLDICPICTIMNDTSSEHVFKDLINSLSLSISLWMVCRASNQLGSERSLQLLPEACNELSSTIRNDHLGHAMELNDLV
jgi:hypothetical protein